MKRPFAFCGLGLLLLAAACGGGNDSNSPELSGTASEFYDLLYRGLDASYQAAYQTTTPEGARGEAYVVYSKPPLVRIDTVPAGTLTADSVLMGGAADDQTIGCSGGPEAWECSAIEPLGDSLLRAAGPIGFLSKDDLSVFNVTRSPMNRSFAGQETTCYILAPASGESAEQSEYCLTAEGVVLYSATPSQTSEATEFRAQVENADFTPPATPG
jgi:hypothetical protein